MKVIIQLQYSFTDSRVFYDVKNITQSSLHPTQPNPTHQKLKNSDPTQPMDGPNPQPTLYPAYVPTNTSCRICIGGKFPKCLTNCTISFLKYFPLFTPLFFGIFIVCGLFHYCCLVLRWMNIIVVVTASVRTVQSPRLRVRLSCCEPARLVHKYSLLDRKILWTSFMFSASPAGAWSISEVIARARLDVPVLSSLRHGGSTRINVQLHVTFECYCRSYNA